jgi:peptidoglycan hydrolase-like protein with peptidoglycan-binding domain
LEPERVRLRCLIAIVVVSAVATVVPGSGASGTSAVTALQVALAHRGLYSGPIDGVRGPATRRATRRLQQLAHISVDGVAGPQTRRKLGWLGRPDLGTRVVRRGMRGWDVAEVQALLRGAGAGTAVDGLFGPSTEAAVRAAQRAAGLSPDGLVGPATVRALQRSGGSVAPLRLARSDVEPSINYWARQYGVDARLARGLAWMESGYHPDLTSPTGAWGVFQVQPDTWSYVETVLARRKFERSVEGNVRVGILYLRQLLASFHGNERLALAAWYTGPQTVARKGIVPVARVFVDNVLALRRRN